MASNRCNRVAKDIKQLTRQAGLQTPDELAAIEHVFEQTASKASELKQAIGGLEQVRNRLRRGVPPRPILSKENPSNWKPIWTQSLNRLELMNYINESVRAKTNPNHTEKEFLKKAIQIPNGDVEWRLQP